MKVHIRPDVVRQYCQKFKGRAIPSMDYVNALKKVADLWLDVETKYLFRDQFNTKDLRIMNESIDAIEDDVH